MNASPFWPLVWKEYRAGRAFWLAMAVMGLVAQAGVAVAGPPAGRSELVAVWNRADDFGRLCRRDRRHAVRRRT